MKQTRQDFFTANGEGIKIMTFTEFARHILRMECGESLGLYAVVNRQTRECSRPLSVRKEQWNGTPFYLLGGHGQEVRTINFAGRPKEEFETTCHDALDSYDAVESIGMEVHVRNGCGVHNIAPVFQMEIIRLIQVAKEFAVRIADSVYLAVECGRHLLLAAVDQQVFTAGLHLFRNPLMQFFRR